MHSTALLFKPCCVRWQGQGFVELHSTFTRQPNQGTAEINNFILSFFYSTDPWQYGSFLLQKNSDSIAKTIR